jgi:hypothetical protein
VHLGITSFCHNDQGAASNIHPFLRKGVLVLRDLGYFSLSSLRTIENRGAHFVSRLRYDVVLYDPKGRLLPLKKLLKNRVVDRCILLGRVDQLRVRLVILPLPSAIAEQRIRKEKHNRDGRVHHTPQYYRFLAYDVFVTHASPAQLSARGLRALYTVRWQIEVLFKALKSGALKTGALLREIRTNHYRVAIVLSLVLCFAAITLTWVYQPMSEQSDLALSVIKVFRWMCTHLFCFALFSSASLHSAMHSYCSYEKRKRINLRQKIKALT